MNRGIYPVLAGAITHERNLELLAHNLGNLQTAGYKKDKPIFGTIFAGQAGKLSAGIDLFPQVADVLPDHGTQGTLRHTGNELDVALEGKGFLVASTSSGLRHFRGGSLRVNGKKQLVTHEGDPVLGKKGPITLPPGPVHIDQSGNVRILRRGDNKAGDGILIDTLRIDGVPKSTVPVKVGNLQWILPGKPEKAKGVTVHQGKLEQANVNVSTDMVEMIRITRGYEQMQKAIQSMDELTGQIIQSSRVQR